MRLSVHLLIVGGGAGAFAAATFASASNLRSLVLLHDPRTRPASEHADALDDAAIAALVEHGVLDVLRPHLVRQRPPTLSVRIFEMVLRRHCLADLNVEVYDAVEFDTATPAEGATTPVRGHLTSHSARWELDAGAMIDTSSYPPDLAGAIGRADADVRRVLRVDGP